jgi:hypothetical protein
MRLTKGFQAVPFRTAIIRRTGERIGTTDGPKEGAINTTREQTEQIRLVRVEIGVLHSGGIWYTQSQRYTRRAEPI